MTTETVTPRQDDLLAAALELIREGGLVGLTVRRLADRVGFSEAAFYRHFPSKQAVLLALIDRLSEERLLTPLRRLATDEQRPVRERLTAMVDHHLAEVLAIDGLPILLLAEGSARGDDELLAPLRRTAGEVLGLLTGLLAQLPRGAGAPPPEDVALLLFGLPAAAGLRHRLLPDAAAEERACGGLAGFLVTAAADRLAAGADGASGARGGGGEVTP